MVVKVWFKKSKTDRVSVLAKHSLTNTFKRLAIHNFKYLIYWYIPYLLKLWETVLYFYVFYRLNGHLGWSCFKLFDQMLIYYCVSIQNLNWKHVNLFVSRFYVFLVFIVHTRSEHRFISLTYLPNFKIFSYKFNVSMWKICR